MASTPGDSQALPRVLVVGATGLVGAHCLRLLVADPRLALVRALVRKPLSIQRPPPGEAAPSRLPLVEATTVDFDRLSAQPELFAVDWVVSALGTTIRQAGSQAQFRRVDFEYPLAVARLARAQGATRFALVSALGANPRSLFFYNRVKGELEEAIRNVGFESVVIAQPSLLEGERQEFRAGEVLGQRVGHWFPERWKPVEGRQVALGLVRALHQGGPGVRILNNIELRRVR